MQYLMILTEVESEQVMPGDPGHDTLMAEYRAFTEMVTRLGVMRGGARLRPTSTATTVRVRDGKVIASDGPFTETKEQFAGFYLLDCQDLDQALELAAKIPIARKGSVEVRPLWEMPQR